MFYTDLQASTQELSKTHMVLGGVPIDNIGLFSYFTVAGSCADFPLKAGFRQSNFVKRAKIRTTQLCSF